MTDLNNELLRLSEMKEKGQISQEEFEAAKAKLLGDSRVTTVQSAVPPSIPGEGEHSAPPAPPVATMSSAAKELPPGIAGWSWGAFLLNWIWAIGNRTWIGLLALVPIINIVMIFVLGAKGREWAWKNKQWDSVEHFNRVQRKWSVWAVWLVLAGLVLGVLLAIASFLFVGKLASEMSTPVDENTVVNTETTETPAISDETDIPSAERDATYADSATDASSTTLSEDAEPSAVEDTTVAKPTDTTAPSPEPNNAVAEDERKHQEELAKTRAEAAAAKAEAAKARKEAQKAEKALADQKRREREEQERLAQEAAEQEQMQCPYSSAQPLTCSSRQGQPAYCDWNFKACGNPRLAKKESKTTCEGKVEWDPGNNKLIVTEGCRARFVPVQ